MVRLKVRAPPLGHPAGKNPVIGVASAPGSHTRPSPSSSCTIKRGSSLSGLSCHLKTTVISVCFGPSTMPGAYVVVLKIPPGCRRTAAVQDRSTDRQDKFDNADRRAETVTRSSDPAGNPTECSDRFKFRMPAAGRGNADNRLAKIYEQTKFIRRKNECDAWRRAALGARPSGPRRQCRRLASVERVAIPFGDLRKAGSRDDSLIAANAI